MTFAEIQTEILSRCNLTSTDASTRIGAAINRHHKRITSLLGMETLRAASIQVNMTVGTRDVVFSGIEKIDRVFDISNPGAVRLLDELSLHRMRTTTPTAVAPQMWAMKLASARSVTIQTDTYPQVVYVLLADGWVTRTDLTAADEPIFPASFHDILTWYVMAEELLRKEKQQQAAAYEAKADALLGDLRFHLADTHTRELLQGSYPSGGNGHPGGGGDAGSGFGGGSYTQIGLITFDRDPQAPFAVSPGSAKVDNLDADKLDGETGADFHDASKLTGTVPVGRLPAHRTTHETGGSDALTALSAGILTSGTLPDARLSSNVQMKPILATDLPTHGARHHQGGADPVTVTALTGFPGGTLNYLRADGTFNVPPGAAGPHHTSHEPGGADAIVALDGSVITQGTVARARLPANLVDVTGTPAANDVAMFSDADTLAASGAVMSSGSVLLNVNASLGRNTSAGADTGNVSLSGAAIATRTRASYLRACGNESPDNGGIFLVLGTKTGASLRILRAAGQDTIVLSGDTGMLSLLDGQLQFPATQKPSTDVNTLDDYREGNWTPSLIGVSGNSGQAYVQQGGSYLKIGRLVYIHGRVILNTLGTFTGNIAIANLPFPVGGGTYTALPVPYFLAVGPANVVGICALPVPSTSRADLFYATASSVGYALLQPVHMTANTDLIFAGSYLASN